VAKSGAEYKVEQRRNAAAEGLCHTCCAVKVAPGRSICPKCSAQASARTIRRRRKIRTKAELDRDVSSLETLGDAYACDGAYRAALNSYRRAFDLSANDATAHARLAIKVGNTSFHRGIATGADDWFNTPPDKTEASTESPSQLQAQIRTLWSSSRTADIVPLSERLLVSAIASNDAGLILSTRLSLVMALLLLSRHDEAERYLHAIDIRTLPQDPNLLSKYHRVCASTFASLGDAEMASESFATALHYAEQETDPYGCISVLQSYATCSGLLGDLERSAGLFLQALKAARERNLGWIVASISLEYAQVLSRQANRDLAHAYVHQALMEENRPPVLLEALAEIGIPIAIECNDASLLGQCADEDALTFSFRSNEPTRLGSVASSFARYFHKIGEPKKARALLAKALKYVKNADEACDLPIAVAQIGDDPLLGPAREVLVRRTLLPNHAVAQAHLHYFDAIVCEREGDALGSVREALVAAGLFRELGWTSYALAATLLSTSTIAGQRSTTGSASPSISSALTLREQSVARLAAVGLSNREIGQRLSISARTVECHMSSILHRLGLRSRHQLLESVQH
jgi:ATP/maltotriose-dependent transcriptional regulator MalT